MVLGEIDHSGQRVSDVIAGKAGVVEAYRSCCHILGVVYGELDHEGGCMPYVVAGKAETVEAQR